MSDAVACARLDELLSSLGVPLPRPSAELFFRPAPAALDAALRSLVDLLGVADGDATLASDLGLPLPNVVEGVSGPAQPLAPPLAFPPTTAEAARRLRGAFARALSALSTRGAVSRRAALGFPVTYASASGDRVVRLLTELAETAAKEGRRKPKPEPKAQSAAEREPAAESQSAGKLELAAESQSAGKLELAAESQSAGKLELAAESQSAGKLELAAESQSAGKLELAAESQSAGKLELAAEDQSAEKHQGSLERLEFGKPASGVLARIGQGGEKRARDEGRAGNGPGAGEGVAAAGHDRAKAPRSPEADSPSASRSLLLARDVAVAAASTRVSSDAAAMASTFAAAADAAASATVDAAADAAASATVDAAASAVDASASAAVAFASASAIVLASSAPHAPLTAPASSPPGAAALAFSPPPLSALAAAARLERVLLEKGDWQKEFAALGDALRKGTKGLSGMLKPSEAHGAASSAAVDAADAHPGQGVARTCVRAKEGTPIDGQHGERDCFASAERDGERVCLAAAEQHDERSRLGAPELAPVSAGPAASSALQEAPPPVVPAFFLDASAVLAARRTAWSAAAIALRVETAPRGGTSGRASSRHVRTDAERERDRARERLALRDRGRMHSRECASSVSWGDVARSRKLESLADAPGPRHASTPCGPASSVASAPLPRSQFQPRADAHLVFSVHSQLEPHHASPARFSAAARSRAFSTPSSPAPLPPPPVASMQAPLQAPPAAPMQAPLQPPSVPPSPSALPSLPEPSLALRRRSSRHASSSAQEGEEGRTLGADGRDSGARKAAPDVHARFSAFGFRARSPPDAGEPRSPPMRPPHSFLPPPGAHPPPLPSPPLASIVSRAVVRNPGREELPERMRAGLSFGVAGNKAATTNGDLSAVPLRGTRDALDATPSSLVDAHVTRASAGAVACGGEGVTSPIMASASAQSPASPAAASPLPSLSPIELHGGSETPSPTAWLSAALSDDLTERRRSLERGGEASSAAASIAPPFRFADFGRPGEATASPSAIVGDSEDPTPAPARRGPVRQSASAAHSAASGVMHDHSVFSTAMGEGLTFSAVSKVRSDGCAAAVASLVTNGELPANSSVSWMRGDDRAHSALSRAPDDRPSSLAASKAPRAAQCPGARPPLSAPRDAPASVLSAAHALRSRFGRPSPAEGRSRGSVASAERLLRERRERRERERAEAARDAEGPHGRPSSAPSPATDWLVGEAHKDAAAKTPATSTLDAATPSAAPTPRDANSPAASQLSFAVSSTGQGAENAPPKSSRLGSAASKKRDMSAVMARFRGLTNERNR